ncbi:hypothetical protein BpHYR1_016170 [Brachionus plicatilis]|uniref:Uncharacterized protein n=1 Tax=Brachionus plicatilis TaxID=10195 RepID=A0A3M7P3W6_BRAPC|nr:hypothetical protein BpHYR1_016170 [Brachionus plicatilis]
MAFSKIFKIFNIPSEYLIIFLWTKVSKGDIYFDEMCNDRLYSLVFTIQRSTIHGINQNINDNSNPKRRRGKILSSVDIIKTFAVHVKRLITAH